MPVTKGFFSLLSFAAKAQLLSTPITFTNGFLFVWNLMFLQIFFLAQVLCFIVSYFFCGFLTALEMYDVGGAGMAMAWNWTVWKPYNHSCTKIQFSKFLRREFEIRIQFQGLFFSMTTHFGQIFLTTRYFFLSQKPNTGSSTGKLKFSLSCYFQMETSKNSKSPPGGGGWHRIPGEQESVQPNLSQLRWFTGGLFLSVGKVHGKGAVYPPLQDRRRVGGGSTPPIPLPEINFGLWNLTLQIFLRHFAPSMKIPYDLFCYKLFYCRQSEYVPIKNL